MNYADIKPLDIANGPGIRVSLFVSGCRRRCKGCFNKEAQAFDYGKEFTSETLQELDRLLSNEHVKGLSILGGEPCERENRETVLDICKHVREVFGDTKTIWMWSGYLWEDLKVLPVMEYIDILIDGPFVQKFKDLSLYYRGSLNQRVIDVPKSLKAGYAIRLEGDWK